MTNKKTTIKFEHGIFSGELLEENLHIDLQEYKIESINYSWVGNIHKDETIENVLSIDLTNGPYYRTLNIYRDRIVLTERQIDDEHIAAPMDAQQKLAMIKEIISRREQ